MKRQMIYLAGAAALILFNACTASPPTPWGKCQTPMHERLTDCYNYLGGAGTLGCATTTPFIRNGVLYQYTENALLKHDPQAPAIQSCQLEALGLQFGVTSPEVSKPEDPALAQWYVDGHNIWEEIAPFYEKYGQGITGAPLTEVYYNPEKRRYEQYFTNLGFYRNENDAVGEFHLMPYGQWYCGQPCQQQIALRDAGPRRLPPPANDAELRSAEESFDTVAERVGWETTGLPQTPAFLRDESTVMKIYDNVILLSQRHNPGKVQFMAVSEGLAIQAGPLVKAKPGCDFYPVQDELGYNICGEIRDYVVAHGGLETMGPPIMEEYATSQTISRQCFENVCLLRHKVASAPSAFKIQVEALGYTYCQLNAFCPRDIEAASPTPVPPAIKLQVWEANSYVASTQSQEIGVGVFAADRTPLANVNVVLDVTMPDGQTITYLMPPTNTNGQTSYKLAPISALNGTLIEYQVCVVSQVKPPVCVLESFYIWENP